MMKDDINKVGAGDEGKDLSGCQDDEDYTRNQLLRGFEKVQLNSAQIPEIFNIFFYFIVFDRF